VGRFWPMTGCRRLVEQALLTAALESAPGVVFVGGEERGTWLLEQGVASDRSYAFALKLTADPAGATGRLAFDPAACAATDEPCPALAAFADALAEHRPLRWRTTAGTWTLDWS